MDVFSTDAGAVVFCSGAVVASCFAAGFAVGFAAGRAAVFAAGLLAALAAVAEGDFVAVEAAGLADADPAVFAPVDAVDFTAGFCAEAVDLFADAAVVDFAAVPVFAAVLAVLAGALAAVVFAAGAFATAVPDAGVDFAVPAAVFAVVPLGLADLRARTGLAAASTLLSDPLAFAAVVVRVPVAGFFAAAVVLGVLLSDWSVPVVGVVDFVSSAIFFIELESL